MKNRRRGVIVLHGTSNVEERPDEADTLLQAELVAASIGRLGFDAELVAVDDEQAIVEILKAKPVDLAFNLVETFRGQGRLASRIPEMLDAQGIRYTGCSTDALAATSAKTHAKQRMRDRGIPTPEWSVDGHNLPRTGHVIVKPVWEDASVGIDSGSVVEVEAAPRELAARATRFGGTWFIEEYVEGREFNISLLDGPNGPDVLPMAEIMFLDFPAGKPWIVDYDAKWITGGFAYHHTPRRFLSDQEDGSLTACLRDLALRCWSLFDLSGYARVDFRVDHQRRPFVIEVNGNPCLSPDAGFTAAAAHGGLEFDDVIARIVEAALAGAIPAPLG